MLLITPPFNPVACQNVCYEKGLLVIHTTTKSHNNVAIRQREGEDNT